MISKETLILRMNFDRLAIGIAATFNGVFITKYIVGQNDTATIATMGILITLTMIAMEPMVSSVRFRQMFRNWKMMFALMFTSGIIMGVSAYMVSGSLLGAYIVAHLIDTILSQPTGALMRDRFLAVFEGEDLIKCSVRTNRWELIGGMIGTALAIVLPLEDVSQVLTVSACIWIMDAFTTGYSTIGVEQYMKENNIVLCSAKVK